MPHSCRLSQDALRWPPASESCAQRLCMNAGDLRPFCQRQRSSVESERQVLTSLIPVLDARRNPPQIAALVPSVVVNAIKRVPRRRPSTDVLQERMERRQKLRRHRNSTTAVVFPSAGFRIGRSLLRVLPDTVLRRTAERAVATLMSTRLWPSGQQVACIDLYLLRTRAAATAPIDARAATLARSTGRTAYNGELTEHAPDKILGMVLHRCGA